LTSRSVCTRIERVVTDGRAGARTSQARAQRGCQVCCVRPGMLNRGLSLSPPRAPSCVQVVNNNLHAAYAELKAILDADLKAAGRPAAGAAGMGYLPAVAVAAVAIGAFPYLRQ
jgi:hypothetical protein